jgi:hypothetical protein
LTWGLFNLAEVLRYRIGQETAILLSVVTLLLVAVNVSAWYVDHESESE